MNIYQLVRPDFSIVLEYKGTIQQAQKTNKRLEKYGYKWIKKMTGKTCIPITAALDELMDESPTVVQPMHFDVDLSDL